MNPVTITIGCLALGYGIFTAIWRAKHPEKFVKLEAMKKAWGERGGLVVHVISYTILPLLLGVILIISGVRGAALF